VPQAAAGQDRWLSDQLVNLREQHRRRRPTLIEIARQGEAPLSARHIEAAVSGAARSVVSVAENDPSTTDPDGRLVVFDAGTRLHLSLGRPELVDEHELILGTVAHPDHHIDDAIPGREHFYRRHVDPRRWLRVVVDFNDEPAWVVTALVQENPPRGWKS